MHSDTGGACPCNRDRRKPGTSAWAAVVHSSAAPATLTSYALALDIFSELGLWVIHALREPRFSLRFPRSLRLQTEVLSASCPIWFGTKDPKNCALQAAQCGPRANEMNSRPCLWSSPC